MWKQETRATQQEFSDADSDSSGEEIPIWVRGETKWVSGIISQTTCQDVIAVLLKEEEEKGRHMSPPENYHITERWRGVEQPLDPQAAILNIWNAWGTAQPEVKISLRRIKDDRPTSRRKRCRSESSTRSDRSAFKTVHPRRIQALQNGKQPSNTEQLIKLVLAQGEVIKRQLRKLRHSEHQIGFLEEKTHKARVRKHGSNYLLETYLRGLSEAVDPNLDEETPGGDKNSDSGVVTEGDSEQSHNKPSSSNETERLSPSSEELQKDLKDDDASSTVSESTVREQLELLDMISRLNKRLLKEEECMVRLCTTIKKCEKETRGEEELTRAISTLRTDMAKSACEMQHNEIVLEEATEKLTVKRSHLENLHKDIVGEDQEFEMLQALLYATKSKPSPQKPLQYHHPTNRTSYTKEILDTLV